MGHTIDSHTHSVKQKAQPAAVAKEDTGASAKNDPVDDNTIPAVRAASNSGTSSPKGQRRIRNNRRGRQRPEADQSSSNGGHAAGQQATVSATLGAASTLVGPKTRGATLKNDIKSSAGTNF